MIFLLRRQLLSTKVLFSLHQHIKSNQEKAYENEITPLLPPWVPQAITAIFDFISYSNNIVTVLVGAIADNYLFLQVSNL